MKPLVYKGSLDFKPQVDTRWGRFTAWLVLGAIVVSYFGLIAGSVKNLPYADDYVVILDYVTKTVEHGFSWPALWQEHNEHRLVFTRLVALGLWKISGQVNFTALILAGNLGWLICGTMLGINAAQRTGTVWAAVPVAAILAVPVHHENMLWAMASLQNYWFAAFAVACIWLISKNRIGQGLMSLGAAAMTSGGALVLISSILGGLLFQQKWKQAIFTSVVGALIVSAYFIGHGSASQPHLTNFSAIAMYSVNFLGSASPRINGAPALGAALAIGLGLVAWGCRRDPLTGMLALFVLMTAMLAAWSRGGLGVAQSLASRYSIFSLLGLSCLWLAWLPRRQHLKLGGSVLMGLAGVAVFAVFKADRWRHQRTTMAVEYFEVAGGYASHAHILPFLNEARIAGVYRPPLSGSLKGTLQAELVNALPKRTETKVRGCIDVFDGSYLAGWAHLPGNSTNTQRLLIVLQSTAGMWVLPGTFYERSDLDRVFHDGGEYLHSGFETILPLYRLPLGQYRVGIFVQNLGQSGILWTEHLYTSE